MLVTPRTVFSVAILLLENDALNGKRLIFERRVV